MRLMTRNERSRQWGRSGPNDTNRTAEALQVRVQYRGVVIFYLTMFLVVAGLVGYLIYRRLIERRWGKHENRDR